MPTPSSSSLPQRRDAVCADDAVRRLIHLLGISGLVLMLVACASGGGQKRGGPVPAWERDGPGSSPPSDLANIPDAVPMVEPFRSGTMRPYEVLGRSYLPITEDAAFRERGLASWYGRKFHGRPTAIGEPYDMYAMTAAHPTLPLPSYVRVRNPANQREVVVRLNDRGPFHPGRIIDLSYTAAFKLDLLRGVAPVEIERITHREIRAGNWQREPDAGWRQPVATTPVMAAHSAAVTVPQLLPISATRSDAARAAAPGQLQPATPLPVASAAAITSSPLPVASAGTAQPVQASAVDGWWVQLGAFRHREGAEFFQRQIVADIGWIAPQLQLRSDAELHRLQAGPYADREQAVGVAERLRESLQLVPVIVERR